MADRGEWICIFVLETEIGSIELGNVSLTLLINNTGIYYNCLIKKIYISITLSLYTEDEMLSWIVGVATTLVLFLMIAVVVLVVCKARLFTNKKSRVFETATTIPKNIPIQNDRQHNENTTKTRATINNFPATNSTTSLNNMSYCRNPQCCDNFELLRYHPSRIYGNHTS